MKKVTILLSIFSALVLFSCAKKEEKETIIENETVVVPVDQNQPAPAAPAEVKNPDGTSVQIGKGGISVSTKSGNNSTQINMSKDSSNVIIKK